MANQGQNDVKLGFFVLTGLLALIFAFYMIGKNRNMFGSNFKLKAHFANLNGLMVGNNVLFSGIQAGTVKSIDIINDSSIEVVLLIGNKIQPFIHKNAIAAIGTEGLMGDKVVNITPGKGLSAKVAEGDLLAGREIVNTDEMLQTLSKTNNNISDISEALKSTVLRINNSTIWSLFNDKELVMKLKSTLNNIDQASANANQMTKSLNEMVTGVKHGKGAAGVLLSDTSLAMNLKQAVINMNSTTANANKLTLQLNKMLKQADDDLANGKGTLHLLLKDSLLTKSIKSTLQNVQEGTDGFNQNMEALKHNFLFRGYFKNLEKQQNKLKNPKSLKGTVTVKQ